MVYFGVARTIFYENGFSNSIDKGRSHHLQVYLPASFMKILLANWILPIFG